MLRTKIIASSISNLTDARYFAAWGAYAMGFDLNIGSANFVSPTQVHAFKDWISGPKIIGEFTGLQSKIEVDELVQVLSLDAIQLGHFAPKDWKFEVPVYREVLITNTEDIPEADNYIIKSEGTWDGHKLDLLTSFTERKPAYLDISLKVDLYQTLIEDTKLSGFVLRGGEEEKVGYKSFDEIDEILEAIEIDH